MRQLYIQRFYPRPIDDEDEHSRNDGRLERSFEDFIGTSFVLIDADLLLIRMNKFQLCFRFHLASCSVLSAVLIISRGV